MNRVGESPVSRLDNGHLLGVLLFRLHLLVKFVPNELHVHPAFSLNLVIHDDVGTLRADNALSMLRLRLLTRLLLSIFFVLDSILPSLDELLLFVSASAISLARSLRAHRRTHTIV